MRNGLIFWAVDRSGSLKSDQPLFPDRKTQLDMRELFVKNPTFAMPSLKVCELLRKSQLEHQPFGQMKHKIVREAIEKTGKYWFGDIFVQ